MKGHKKRKTTAYAAKPLPTPIARDAHPPTATGGAKVVPAGLFKAKCLGLMDEVHRTGKEIAITKHGRVVAKLAPVKSTSGKPFIGRMKTTMKIVGDVMAPDAPDWTVDADL